MKKLISLLLAVTMLLGVVSLASAEGAAYKVAMITDSGDITDQSFNLVAYGLLLLRSFIVTEIGRAHV